MRKKIFLFLAISWTGVILFLCLINSHKLKQISIPNFDKVIHIFFHFVLTTLWFLFFKKKFDSPNNIRPLVISVVFSFFVGIIVEFLQQYLTTTRTGDILDVVANLFGALLAVSVILLLSKRTDIMDKI